MIPCIMEENGKGGIVLIDTNNWKNYFKGQESICNREV